MAISALISQKSKIFASFSQEKPLQALPRQCIKRSDKLKFENARRVRQALYQK